MIGPAHPRCDEKPRSDIRLLSAIDLTRVCKRPDDTIRTRTERRGGRPCRSIYFTRSGRAARRLTVFSRLLRVNPSGARTAARALMVPERPRVL